MGFTCHTNKTQLLLGLPVTAIRHRCYWVYLSHVTPIRHRYYWAVYGPLALVVSCDTKKTQASDKGIMVLWLPVTPIKHRCYWVYLSHQ